MRHGGRRQKEREGQERGTGKKIDHHRRRSRLDVVSSFSDILRRAEETSEILTDLLALVLLFPRHPVGIAQVAAAFP